MIVDWNAPYSGREYVLIVVIVFMWIAFFYIHWSRYRFGVIDGHFNSTVPPVASIIERERVQHSRRGP